MTIHLDKPGKSQYATQIAQKSLAYPAVFDPTDQRQSRYII